MTIRKSKIARWAKKHSKQVSKMAYVGTFVFIVSFLIIGSQNTASIYNADDQTVANTEETKDIQANDSISVDQLAAVSAITNLAEVTSLPVAGDLREATTTLHIKKELAQTDAEVIAKPQIIEPTTSTERGITSYVVKDGDSMETIARRFNISTQTLRWANNATSDAVEVGKKLVVPLTDGIVYTVKEGDTLKSLAEKYKVSPERIFLYNDLEAGAPLVKNTRIVLPSGNLPETERPGYVAPRTYSDMSSIDYYGGGSMGGSILSRRYGFPGPTAGNRYSAGNCTWYAYERRVQLGRPVGGMWGNAYSWVSAARSSGYLVDQNPTPGAVVQTSGGGGGYGHVGVVERIEGNKIIISDMNYAGYNVVTWREISLDQARGFWYIH